MGYIFTMVALLLLAAIWFGLVNKRVPEGGRTVANAIVGSVIGLIFAFTFIAGGWSYADPGYSYQVRGAFGTVKAAGIDKPGWFWSEFGSVYPWPKAISVEHAEDDPDKAEDAGSLYPLKIRMLDRVDGVMSQTTRFRLPSDEVSFLRMAEEYRSPENLLRTELIPAVTQVINASASLMGAEDYFNGQSNQLQIDFDYQMRSGIYVVERKEVKVHTEVDQKGSANAAKGDKQDEYGPDTQIKFVVEKLRDKNGNFQTRPHNYKNFGIDVIDAKITAFVPNKNFVERMEKQQKASADRAIARETKVQEEEQRQLAIVRGQREIAEEQAKVQKEQIQKTTVAETEKALALITANKAKESALIEKETAAIQLERDRIRAQQTKVLADATAYEKEAMIAADNGLKDKLAAEIKIHEYWAAAYKERKVPEWDWKIGADASGKNDNADFKQMMQLITAASAKSLDYNREIKK